MRGLEGTDVCFAPVMRLGEAAEHAGQQGARHMFVPGADGRPEVAPAPRFAVRQAQPAGRTADQGADTWTRSSAKIGVSADEIVPLRSADTVA